MPTTSLVVRQIRNLPFVVALVSLILLIPVVTLSAPQAAVSARAQKAIVVSVGQQISLLKKGRVGGRRGHSTT